MTKKIVISLIKKNICFNRLYIIASCIAPLIMAICYIEKANFVSGSEYSVYIGAVMGSQLFLSRLCYSESNYASMNFLKTLVYPLHTIVVSSYITNALDTILVFSLTFCVTLTIDSLFISILLISISVSFVYSGVFLLIFYRYGYPVAKNTLIFVLGFVMLGIYLYQAYQVDVLQSFIYEESHTLIAGVILLLSIAFYLISMALSSKSNFYSM